MMKQTNFWKRSALSSLLVAALALAVVLAVPGVHTVHADSAPTVTVSCRIEPAGLQAGDTGTLYVEVDVPAAPATTGMNAYDLEMSFDPSAVSFLEASPRPGVDPWNSTFNLNGENIIDNTTGKINAARLKNSPNVAFFGKGTLFSAPFTLTADAPAEIAFTDVKIPQFATPSQYYAVNAVPCTAGGDTGDRYLYLPMISNFQ